MSTTTATIQNVSTTGESIQWYNAQIRALRKWLDKDITRDADEYDSKLREYHALRAELKNIQN